MKFRANTKTAVFLAAALFASRNIFCQETVTPKIETSRLPPITSLERLDKDIILAQYRDELEQNYIAIRRGKTPELSFYAYKAKKNDTVFKIAATLNITADSFSTINKISSPEEFIEGHTLILPTARGLFIPHPQDNDGSESAIEILLQKNRFALLESDEVLWYNINGRRYAFMPDEILTPTERAFFLDPAMVLPVSNYTVSSRFGNRKDPFGSGSIQNHKGIDIAVPQGSEVFACKSGRVAGSGEDEVFGKWILLEHAKGMSSFYAHLSSIEAEAGKFVRTGELIAKSGSTGQATGAHLHFEVRKNGSAVDPSKYLEQ